MTLTINLAKANYYLDQWFGRFKLPFILAAVLLLVTFSLTALFSDERSFSMSGAQLVFEGRNFTNTPFGLMDAYDACVLEAKAKLGENLLRQTMLPLSTRVEKDNTYTVVLDADIGTIREWVSAHVYCSVDPKKEKISYYKEVYDGQPTLLSRTMNVLGKMIN